jgi:hypothetical protein
MSDTGPLRPPIAAATVDDARAAGVGLGINQHGRLTIYNYGGGATRQLYEQLRANAGAIAYQIAGYGLSDGVVDVEGPPISDQDPGPPDVEQSVFIQPVQTTRPLMTSYTWPLLLTWWLEDAVRAMVRIGWSEAEIAQAEAKLKEVLRDGNTIERVVTDRRIVIIRREGEISVSRFE